MSKVLSDQRSVAATTVVDNILSGKLGEFLEQDSSVRIGIVASGVDVDAKVLIGSEVVVDGQEVSDGNRYPQDPEDFAIETAGLAGDRLIVGLNNRNAAARTVKTVVKIAPV